jgi:hypothetical protein
VAFLEARLPDHAEDHYDTGLDSLTNAPCKDTEEPTVVAQPQSGHSGHSHRASVSEDQDVDDRTSLIDGVAYLSLCASGTTGGKHEPYYVGSSSGATIARVLQSSIFRGAGGRAISQPVFTEDCQSSETSRPSLSAQSDGPVCNFPDLERSRMLFDVFFERIHTRWPLLDRIVYTKVFEKQHDQCSLTITERSILHLIYAITARFLSLTRKPCGVDYEVSSDRRTMYRQLTCSSINSWQLLHLWITFWINIISRPSSSLYFLVFMAKGLLTVLEPGLKSDTPPQYV